MNAIIAADGAEAAPELTFYEAYGELDPKPSRLECRVGLTPYIILP